LVAYILPSTINNIQEANDAKEIADKLKIKRHISYIDNIVKAYAHTNFEALQDKFHTGNLIARVRANILNTHAATEKKLLLGTGNMDEDFGIGYFTLFGDGAVHMNPIGNLSKRHVKQMAIYLGFEDVAKREPTAGLEPNQTDFKDLGYNYEAVEIVLEAYCYYYKDWKRISSDNQVIKIIKPQLKRSKFDTVDEIVNDIEHRHRNIAMSKAKIIHAPKAEISYKNK